MRFNKIKLVCLEAAVVGLILISGCSLNNEPRMRLGSYATDTLGTNFLDMNSLGRHSYAYPLPFFENNGIVYTCRGGHIDITHLRINADNVRYLYYKIRKNLLSGNHDFTFKLNVESSTYFVTIDYPPDWNLKTQEEKEIIADEIAIELSQYYTFTMTTWHEVLTWFGYKCMGIVPEQPSAFSWEDIYSNLAGIIIGTEVLMDKSYGYNGYNKAVTLAIRKELEDLGIQSAQTARHASAKMRGIWYDGTFFIDMKIRNFDIGTDDSFVTPILVPGICEGAEPKPYPVPTLEKFHKYGFDMSLEIELREFESGQIISTIYPEKGHKRIRPAQDIPVIMEYIKKQQEGKTFAQKKQIELQAAR